jgi:hypothetical protein
MWDLMLTGLYSAAQIRELANNEWGFRTRPTRKMGGKPMVESAIYQIFTKPFYYGWFEYPKGSDQWYQGKHEPMITEAEYDRVQTLLGRNGSPRPSIHTTFAFTGLIRCGECDARVTAEEKHQLICGNCRFKFACRRRQSCPRCHVVIEKMTNPKFLRYTYYHCTKSKNPRCSQKCISGAELERQIEDYLSRIQISERFKDWAIKYLHELHEQESKSRTDDIQAQHKAYDACLRQIDNLVKLKTSPQNADGSLLSDEEYGRQRVELLKEKSRLEELLQDTGHRVEKWLESSEKTFEFACMARTRFAKGNFQIKKEMLVAIGSNLTLKDKTLLIEALKPFEILEMSLSRCEEEPGPIEPQNMQSTHGSIEDDTPLSPRRLGDLGNVRTSYHRRKELVRAIYHFFRSACVSLPSNCPTGFSYITPAL